MSSKPILIVPGEKKSIFFEIFFKSLKSKSISSPLILICDKKNLNKEIKRILKPGGLNIYTARNMDDGDYKKGIFRGENLYENDGFIVHFFSIEKVNSLLDGFKNIFIENFVEGKFPRKLYMVCNKKI